MLDPVFQTTQTLEANIELYGMSLRQLAELSDDDARRLGELLIEWSKR